MLRPPRIGPSAAPAIRTVNVCRVIGTGVNGSGNRDLRGDPGEHRRTHHQHDVAHQRAGDEVGQNARPRRHLCSHGAHISTATIELGRSARNQRNVQIHAR